MASDLPDRPQPLATAPPRSALLEVYVELLAIARERLAVAVRIERERGFVFPETTVIARDVRTLAEKVYGPAAAAAEASAPSEAARSAPGGAGAGAAPGGAPAESTDRDTRRAPADSSDDGAGEVEAMLRELGELPGLDDLGGDLGL